MDIAVLEFATYALDYQRRLPKANLRPVTQSFNALYSQIKSADPHLLRIFADRNHDIFSKVELILKEAPEMRTFYDRLAKFKLFPTKQGKNPITHMFEKFIKGITYFSDQPLSKRTPAYHRLFSCGYGTYAFREHYLQCTSMDKKEDRDARKKRVTTCYIERLIYDRLWKHGNLHFPQLGTEESTPQDEGHQHFIEITQKDFQTCFPHTDIQVEIEYDTSDWPARLNIFRFVHGVQTSQEIYEKEIIVNSLGETEFGPFVLAYRIKGKIIETKTQSFVVELPWRPCVGEPKLRVIVPT
jgi:hypothetical protein